MAPQESVGGLGCPLDQIRCRRHPLSCSWIHPHRQPWHHLGETHLNPRPKPKPLHKLGFQLSFRGNWSKTELHIAPLYLSENAKFKPSFEPQLDLKRVDYFLLLIFHH